MIKNIKWILFASLAIVSCSQDQEDTSGIEPEVAVSAGSVDFSRYVALGNSITAGYTDKALFKAGQAFAYPKLMADQFATVGGGEFKTPFMNDNYGGLLLAGLPVQGVRLVFNGTAPVSLPGAAPTTEITNFLTGGFNNMGVPGAKSYHLLAPGYGNPAGLLTSPATANPYFVRFASNGTTSVLADAMAQSPTFFSLWIGNNDVLGYATSGGDGSDPITPVSGAPGAGFDGTYAALISTLTSAGAKGVVANIPDVTTIPFVTYVGYNPIPELTQAQVDQLNAGYAAYNGGLVAAKNLGLISEEERLQRTIVFTAGKKRPVVMLDEYLTDITAVNPALIKMRLSTPEDYVILSYQGGNPQTHLAAGNGTQFPLQDGWVLSKNEVQEIRTATAAYNEIIKAQAEAKGLAFVDAAAIMNQVANGGILVGNYHFTNQFIQGGAFGLDGVHLTPRANAYVANKFLEAIEKTYGASFKKYKVQDFPISYPSFLPN
ncbi:G-D-S-L family lipolytic protein [Flavobacterium sp. CYK-4]|uniref:G-D-S-L family lipolytic protein n=1 Tax=Flavobacterium lotistagni TaxID=2709660 RepID=UPI0014077E85|nr:G-D-S-L family lipolytic protein [Flavobacterium lotistagni]NHM06587.1 G-D-S-L family lipolytic protein [Flavobacterium lotistagni]